MTDHSAYSQFVARFRQLWRDGHHQLDQERAVGNVSAAEKMVEIGRRNGMSETETAELMREAVTTEMEHLIQPHKKRRRRRSRALDQPTLDLPQPEQQRALPPGTSRES
ncbi:MAG: hypothetical protein QOG93_81 [Gaiellaceae bacterium]|nr:hypothetical protein [Gaiellaceae bacterium]